MDKDSAIMGLAQEQKMMLSGTHTSICRFRRGDRQFNIVLRRIKRVAGVED